MPCRADAACKRICVAKAARRYPVIFAAIADGRLNLSTVVMLAPHLLPETAQELLPAAAGLTKDQVAHLLAARFPKPDRPTVIQPLPGPVSPAPVPVQAQSTSLELSAPGRISPIECPPAAQVAVPLEPRPRVTPLSPQRYAMQVTVSKATHDKLRHARELLSHALPSGDVAEIIDRALDALILQLERSKFAATDRPDVRRTVQPRIPGTSRPR